MKKIRPIAALSAAIVLVAGLTALGTAQDTAQAQTTTITAEVIDSACYMSRGATGPDHAQCAVMCAENGVPLALLEEGTGTVYIALDGMNNPNDKLKKFAAKKVKVTGKVTKKGNIQSITLEKVEEVKM